MKKYKKLLSPMQSKRIKYFSYHGCSELDHLRFNSPAADTKVDYIIEVLNRIGYAVDHISSAPSGNGKFQWGFTRIQGVNTFRWLLSFPLTDGPIRVFYRWVNDIFFFLWCFIYIKRNEQVLVYHSLGYDSTFLKLKRIKNIRIIGDIEEIYQDVSKQKSSRKRNEYCFIEVCDKFMFPNTILNERFNMANKPYLVCHGIYKVRQYEPVSYRDGKIHILYAGTYDPNKGGARASVEAAEFLDERYHLHITGFGSKQCENEISAEVERIIPLTNCQITFHGYLDDDAFIDLMHHCSIGLCTQDPTNQFNLTSFPSKILNYIANGLVVISGRNRAIEESQVADLLYFYDEQTPSCIARTIMSIRNPQNKDGFEKLRFLDQKFQEDLKNIIQ